MSAQTTPRRVLRALDERDGRTCAWHGAEGSSRWRCRPETLVPQHRQRGMGGRADLHRLSNLVWLCSRLNGQIEADPALLTEAVGRGISIPLEGDPEQEPIEHAVHGRVVLTDEGRALPLLVEPWGES